VLVVIGIFIIKCTIKKRLEAVDKIFVGQANAGTASNPNIINDTFEIRSSADSYP
jgi:hypothetical protein